jgi:hypothetical protein
MIKNRRIRTKKTLNKIKKKQDYDNQTESGEKTETLE